MEIKTKTIREMGEMMKNCVDLPTDSDDPDTIKMTEMMLAQIETASFLAEVITSYEKNKKNVKVH